MYIPRPGPLQKILINTAHHINRLRRKILFILPASTKTHEKK